MNAFFNLIAEFFADEEPKVEIKKPKLTFEQRKKAADAAINRGLLTNHAGAHPATKIDIAGKLRKRLAESYAKNSDIMLSMVERSIFSFERYGY